MVVNDGQVGGDHYRSMYQHWDLVLDTGMGYLGGCATKYVARHRRKGGIEDLRKAGHYLTKLREYLGQLSTATRPTMPPSFANAVWRFCTVNGLNPDEAEFMWQMVMWQDDTYLATAEAALHRLIEAMAAEDYKPGTPEDGGHHEPRDLRRVLLAEADRISPSLVYPWRLRMVGDRWRGQHPLTVSDADLDTAVEELWNDLPQDRRGYGQDWERLEAHVADILHSPMMKVDKKKLLNSVIGKIAARHLEDKFDPRDIRDLVEYRWSKLPEERRGSPHL